MDTDAAAYIAAVETADGQALEERTKIAIDNFVLGCKADGIWTAIKASCILAGARTLAGALVPLVGTAPTNNNFVSGDYNRKTGLGDGSNTTKFLNTNRAENADPQDNIHLSFYASSGDTTANVMGIGSTYIRNNATQVVYACRLAEFATTARTRSSTGFFGVTRSAGASFTRYASGSPAINESVTAASSAPGSESYRVFTRVDPAASLSQRRIAFYSIGESLDLQKLDSRVTDLITAFGVAIP
jgi:hypothetical protein